MCLCTVDVMRRTAALCMYWFLLAFSDLLRTTASWDEEPADVHWTRGAEGPCTVTLTPAGPCEQGEETCPYRVHLPPLAVQLPRHLSDLEEIVKEIQRLKDTVDQLRKSCGGCPVNPSERGEDPAPRHPEGGGDNHPEESWSRLSNRESTTQEGCGTHKVEDWESGNTVPGRGKVLEDRGTKNIGDQPGKQNIFRKESDKEVREYGEDVTKGVDNSRPRGQTVDRSTLRDINTPDGSREDEVKEKIFGKDKDRRKDVVTEKEEEPVPDRIQHQEKEKQKYLRGENNKDREDVGAAGDGGHPWSNPKEVPREGTPSAKRVWDGDEARMTEKHTGTNATPLSRERGAEREGPRDGTKLDVDVWNLGEFTTASEGEGRRETRDHTGLSLQKGGNGGGERNKANDELPAVPSTIHPHEISEHFEEPTVILGTLLPGPAIPRPTANPRATHLTSTPQTFRGFGFVYQGIPKSKTSRDGLQTKPTPETWTPGPGQGTLGQGQGQMPRGRFTSLLPDKTIAYRSTATTPASTTVTRPGLQMFIPKPASTVTSTLKAQVGSYNSVSPELEVLTPFHSGHSLLTILSSKTSTKSPFTTTVNTPLKVKPGQATKAHQKPKQQSKPKDRQPKKDSSDNRKAKLPFAKEDMERKRIRPAPTDLDSKTLSISGRNSTVNTKRILGLRPASHPKLKPPKVQQNHLTNVTSNQRPKSELGTSFETKTISDIVYKKPKNDQRTKPNQSPKISSGSQKPKKYSESPIEKPKPGNVLASAVGSDISPEPDANTGLVPVSTKKYINNSASDQLPITEPNHQIIVEAKYTQGVSPISHNYNPGHVTAQPNTKSDPKAKRGSDQDPRKTLPHRTRTAVSDRPKPKIPAGSKPRPASNQKSHVIAVNSDRVKKMPHTPTPLEDPTEKGGRLSPQSPEFSARHYLQGASIPPSKTGSDAKSRATVQSTTSQRPAKLNFMPGDNVAPVVLREPHSTASTDSTAQLNSSVFSSIGLIPTPSPGNTNTRPGTVPTPSPGQIIPMSRTIHSPGKIGSEFTASPNRADNPRPALIPTPVPDQTDQWSETTPHPGHSSSSPGIKPAFITDPGRSAPVQVTPLSLGHTDQGEGNQGNLNQGQNKEGNVYPGHSNLADDKPGNRNPDPTKLGDSNPGHTTLGHRDPGPRIPGQGNPGESHQGQTNPGHVNPGLSYPGDSNPDHTKLGHSNPGSILDNLNPGLHNPGLQNPPRPALPSGGRRTNPGTTLSPSPEHINPGINLSQSPGSIHPGLPLPPSPGRNDQGPGTQSTTPSTREMRVKMNQVVAFPDASTGHQPIKPQNELMETSPPKVSLKQGGKKPLSTDGRHPMFPSSKLPRAPRDCSDHFQRGDRTSGLHLAAPDPRFSSFPVVCDMEHHGGGWTVIQQRRDGSVSFNRTWREYREGFGEMMTGGEFWLGNEKIHFLTRARDVVLRVELEDFGGVKEYAEYGTFRVASERQRYRLTVGDYSGSAGDALRFSNNYDHHNRAFTTPDRDHDRYPSGNCGAYYGSGWWFDSCMAANLNGKYYVGKYKGVRDGIFWGTWHNISTEYYLTSDRNSFKTVTMMIRPRAL